MEFLGSSERLVEPWSCGAMVERPLWKREVLGSILIGSKILKCLGLTGLAIVIFVPPLGVIDIHTQCPKIMQIIFNALESDSIL